MRTCIYVYFVHLLFNSDLPSIYLIRSGDGRISYSILPRWDFFVHRHKERNNTTHCDWNEFRACAATSHAFQFGSALLWATFGATLGRTIASFLGRIPPSLSPLLKSQLDRLENSLSIYIFGILNLTCYFPCDPGWVGQTCFCWTQRQNSDMPKKKLRCLLVTTAGSEVSSTKKG